MGKEKVLNIRVDISLYEELEAKADEKGISISEYCRRKLAESKDEWIHNRELYPIVQEMIGALNKYEEKEPRVVKKLKHIIKKLEELIR